MSTEDGISLEDLIIESLYRGPRSEERCIRAIENLAVSLALLSRSDIPEAVSLATPCSNSEYVDRIREFLEHSFAQEVFGAVDGGPQRLLDRLPPDFWHRHEKRLLHGDFQAKNVLVEDDDSVILIDMDLGRGHPLFDVAQFLTQLIRISRRWRYPRATRLLKCYGDHFFARYCREGFEYLREDLPFFMLWALTFSILEDAKYPRPVRWYISQHLKHSVLANSWGLREVL